MGFKGGICRFCGGCTVVIVAIVAVIVGFALKEQPVTTPYRHDAVSSSAAIGAAASTGGGSAGLGSGEMFDRIAWAYDVGNRYMSLGLDQFWRETMLNECLQLQKGDRVIDLATGTADVALLVGARLSELGDVGDKGFVVGIDPSTEMLRRGVEKVERSGLPRGLVRLSKGDAQDLHAYRLMDAEGGLADKLSTLDADSVDKISMSFGIRNVPDRARALREMHRILRKSPTSRVCILEFSLPSGRTTLSWLSRSFVTHVVPFIGRLTTLGRGGDEYRYLEESIAKFPSPWDFAALMTREGLLVANITEFAFGSVQLYNAHVRFDS
eukprot:TRINITY_DN10731_c0_g1_i1.p1 TRINITY_DN10731_c0_g1~~TRINITY_DN10731_c0_g1_i1.p1  ORF type:complete len:325 (-),score=47.76 TRINITY_DN10731_c0_g1_i1:175-1149(-)